MTRPSRNGQFYEHLGLRLDARQFEAPNEEISSSIILNDVSIFGSVPVFADESSEDEGSEKVTITIEEDENSLKVNGRMLSAVLIPGYWIDYSDPNLWTEDTAKKFSSTLYLNHGDWGGPKVEEWIGACYKPRISETNGVLGVDATFKIDKKRDMALTQGAIVSGLKHDPPTVKNFSVGINHKLKKSHQFEDYWEFWEKLGTEVDGSIVRFIVTGIDRIRECSLVYAGADPNAKAYSLSMSAQMENERSQLSAASAADKGERQMPISALLAKAIFDVTGINYSEADEVKIIPALYSVKGSADSSKANAEKLADIEKRYSDMCNVERERLIKHGKEVSRNLNDSMSDWANSLSIEQLRQYVENAAPVVPGDVRPAPGKEVKGASLITPSLPEGLSHADIELISSRFNMKSDDIYNIARSNK